MSFQWTAIAVILYSEMAFIVLMMLPWIRPPIWAKIFRSRLVRALEHYSYIFKYTLGGILTLLFLDAVRETRKYSVADQSMDVTQHMAGAQADTLIHMRLFRAQRNLYISGFTIFLALVIYRMIQLVINEARLMASADASLKQAQSAAAAAQVLMEKDPKKRAKLEAEDDDKKKKLVEELRKQLKTAEEERDAMREQADDVKKEYDELTNEHRRLEAVVKRSGDAVKTQ